MRSYFDLGQTLIFPESATEFGLDHTQTSIMIPSTFMFQIEVPLCSSWKVEKRAINKIISLLPSYTQGGRKLNTTKSAIKLIYASRQPLP